jgi:hypothetical protein
MRIINGHLHTWNPCTRYWDRVATPSTTTVCADPTPVPAPVVAAASRGFPPAPDASDSDDDGPQKAANLRAYVAQVQQNLSSFL